MHIEPGIVDGTKIILSYAAAAVPCGYAVKLAAETIVVEPLVDLGVLAIAKSLRGTLDGAFVTRRLHHAA